MSTDVFERYDSSPFVRRFAPGSKMFVHPGVANMHGPAGTWAKVGTTVHTPVKHMLAGGDIMQKGMATFKYKVPQQRNRITAEMARRLPVGGSVPRVVGSQVGEDGTGYDDGSMQLVQPGPTMLPPSLPAPPNNDAPAARRAPFDAGMAFRSPQQPTSANDFERGMGPVSPPSAATTAYMSPIVSPGMIGDGSVPVTIGSVVSSMQRSPISDTTMDQASAPTPSDTTMDQASPLAPSDTSMQQASPASPMNNVVQGNNTVVSPQTQLPSPVESLPSGPLPLNSVTDHYLALAQKLLLSNIPPAMHPVVVNDHFVVTWQGREIRLLASDAVQLSATMQQAESSGMDYPTQIAGALQRLSSNSRSDMENFVLARALQEWAPVSVTPSGNALPTSQAALAVSSAATATRPVLTVDTALARNTVRPRAHSSPSPPAAKRPKTAPASASRSKSTTSVSSLSANGPTPVSSLSAASKALSKQSVSSSASTSPVGTSKGKGKAPYQDKGGPKTEVSPKKLSPDGPAKKTRAARKAQGSTPHKPKQENWMKKGKGKK